MTRQLQIILGFTAVALAGFSAMAQPVTVRQLDTPQPEAAPAPGGLTVTPQEVVFPSSSASAWLNVQMDGNPVPAKQINARIAGSYGWMFTIEKPEKQPGLILLRGNPGNTEFGQYELIVSAAGREQRVRVVVTLANEMAQLTEAQRPKARVLSADVQLPAEYREGQVLELDFSSYCGNCWYSWKVNDAEVLEGVGEHTLRYTFSQAGPVEIQVEGKRDGATAVEWKGNTTVLAHTVENLQLKSGASLTLRGPSGYSEYEWRIDDANAGSESALTHKFDRAGLYRVECIARSPEGAATTTGYYRYEWSIQVQ